MTGQEELSEKHCLRRNLAENDVNRGKVYFCVISKRKQNKLLRKMKRKSAARELAVRAFPFVRGRRHFRERN